VFTARYALSPYITQTRFVFKGLICKSYSLGSKLQYRLKGMCISLSLVAVVIVSCYLLLPLIHIQAKHVNTIRNVLYYIYIYITSVFTVDRETSHATVIWRAGIMFTPSSTETQRTEPSELNPKAMLAAV
jgi:hypothetical protein